MNNDTTFLNHLLDSLKDPFVFVNTDHVITYMNKTARDRHAKDGDLMGTSIFDCHNDKSNEMIKEIFQAMKAGEDERLITDNEKHRIYMRAVRDDSGTLIGYYERYEPPAQ